MTRGGRVADVCETACVDVAMVERARAALPGHERLLALADLFRAVGDPTRLRLVLALAVDGVEELCVCDLAALAGVSQSAVSHALRSLRELHIVRFRRAGKIAYYRLDDAHVLQLVREGLTHVHEPRDRNELG